MSDRMWMALPCTEMRIFWAVKLLPTGIVPMLPLNAESEEAGISIKVLTPEPCCLLPSMTAIGLPLCPETFATPAGACVEVEAVAPSDTGICRCSDKAEAPQFGVVLTPLRVPIGIWKVSCGPLARSGPLFSGDALVWIVEESSTLKLMSKPALTGFGSPG